MPSIPIRARAARAALAAVLAAAALLFLAACVSSPHEARGGPAAARVPNSSPPVLLVSIDGFRPDYLELGITPNLQRLVDGGVRAEWMNPSYPSLTFPNHYSIVTGLRPDRHGIVHNSMEDAGLGVFRLSNREAVGDGRWWGGEPIWVGAHKAGLPNATLFWPGSEAPVQGVRPDRWKPFDADMPYETRVDTVLGWLAEPAATRPRIATLYFERVDKAGHDHGPDSPETRAAVAEADAAIGRLLDGLQARDLLDAVNLIVVSDHGMAATRGDQAIAVEDIVSMQDGKVVSYGQSVGIEPMPGRAGEVERRLVERSAGRHEHYQCWRKQELPARWHYGRNPRVPSIICQMDEGWDAIPAEYIERRRTAGTRGSHGYDPALPSMRALFVAHGPAFRDGVTVPPFENVDVYPLLARLVGIVPAENDGDIAPLLPALESEE
ncbi:ectonucleotide pyrophosphatase/phosphodiesterase [Marilutibacter chinensis]|uniref:Ectonucleotide pyrophosphatase/phosphodiesterase n=1 Tax=Marilutibacter chinensis TaxID=2912247 RepID=A0ABS9HQN3_9GAMM|nr:ectonucleotide pyrophosphatase/phosphodiesterase [Lysobacter chinensis]MCF7221241.1 ectonucleotide pyrophosphatase/phosphodiesterase [Lysobacter chinensis]MCF7223018.1 ectonucleotide pyrophosphatase/phosphodiesterase [Lysobacter chinensis]